MLEKSKKVLFVIGGALVKAGVQAVIMDVARKLSDDHRFDILITSEKKGYYDDEFEALGGKIFRFAVPKNHFCAKIDYYVRGLRLYKKISKILKENGPYDAIHCHIEHEAGICLAAAKNAGVPVRISHTHAMHSSKAHIISKIQKNVYGCLIQKNATHKLGCSEQACKSFYINHSDSQVANNPYDSNRFIYGNHPEPKFSSPSILQVGTFSVRKNQMFSLEIIAEIKKTYPDVKFNMIGFEINISILALKDRISELGLDDNVRIYPQDTDSAKMLAESTGMLMPSRSEAFGIVAIESQAMGVKCYASDVVSKSTDCGGCEYLPLEAGADYWAQKIIDDFKMTGGKHQKYDCSAFASETVANEYRKIYGGSKL